MNNPIDKYTENYNPDILVSSPDPDSANPKRQEQKPEASDNDKTIFSGTLRIRIFAGVISVLLAIYVFAASILYFRSAEADQSRILNNSISELANRPESISNPAGPLGDYIGNLLINEWFGVGSLFLILYVGIVGLSLLRLIKVHIWSLTFRCLLLTLSVSLVFGLAFMPPEGIFYWGGKHGYYINDFLIRHAGIWGALAVNISLIALVVLLYLSQITNLYIKWRKNVEAHRRRIQAIAEAREAERKKVETAMTAEPENKADSTPADNPQISEADNQQDAIVGFDDIPEEEPSLTVQPALTEDSILADTDRISESANTAELTLASQPVHTDTPEPLIIPATDDTPAMEIVRPEVERAKEINTNTYDPTAELSHFSFPSIDLLEVRDNSSSSVDQQEQEDNKQRITKTLKDYGIEISTIKATVGPTVTLYEIVPAEGVRIAKIKRLEDDIALSLSALGIRIIAPIPGKGTIGIEVPNKDPQIVSMNSIIASRKYQETQYELPMAIGSTISNEVFIADLAKMPHLLVAGATGMGKSVGLNAIITSLLYRKHPAELKFVLIDPKMVEFSLYNKLENHYLAKLPEEEDAIITDTSKVIATLNSLCVEMDNRYNLLRMANVRGIKEYNAKFTSRRLNPEKGHRYMPYIVVIIDEFADLIMTAGKEVEMPIARIAQKARAVGIHLIIATQRPSTNVITGIIKANFPGRIAFRVTQMVDSRTILDRPGANQLIGRGDMLISRDGVLDRVQCAFVDTPEVVAICDCIASQPGYGHPYELPEPPVDGGEATLGNVTDRDPLFEEAARFIVGSGTASTSSLQRRYSIGYNRAGKIMDQMEAAGFVGPSQGGKPRQVLIDPMSLEAALG